MTGRNPWVVLGVVEDAPYHEVQRAFRRRAKQTHPDSGGDAAQFASVVQAFRAVRQALPLEHPRRPPCPTPYDPWLRPCSTTRSWTEGGRPVPAASRRAAGSWSSPTTRTMGSEFTDVLAREMSKARAAALPG